MFSWFIVESFSCGIMILFSSQASVVRTPSPPAFVMIAALFPSLSYLSNILATSKSCLIESTSIMPACFRIPE